MVRKRGRVENEASFFDAIVFFASLRLPDDLHFLHQEDEGRPSKALTEEQFEELKVKMSHRTKLRMKLNLLGMMTSVTSGGGGGKDSGGGDGGKGVGSSLTLKSEPGSRQPSRESLNERPGKGKGHYTVVPHA